ncbi:MAG: hypothetical protein EOM70_13050, partial [Clostridia bacterium]|nr:hypothetical protein [Clostridia bacterium]
TLTFPAPTSFLSDTLLTLEALADASDEVGEFREDNNSAIINFTVRALLPDLAGTITTDKSAYEAGETIQVTFQIRNDGALPVSGFNSRWQMRTIGQPVEAQGQLDDTATSVIAALGNVQHAVSFTAPSRIAASTLIIELDLDYDNRITELDEGNNLIRHSISVNEIRSDLAIISDNITTYLTDKDVVIAAKICNQSPDPLTDCAVRLEFGTQTLNEEIPIPAYGENLAVFRVRTPNTPGNYTIQVWADPENQINEGDEGNNQLHKSVTVGPELRISMPDPDSATMAQPFIAAGKFLPALSKPVGSTDHTWQEYRLENSEYVLKTFWMRLTPSLAVAPDPRIAIAGSPDVMESGFGLAAQARTVITTNYDHPEKLVGPQLAYCYYPESSFGLASFANWADELIPAVGSRGNFDVTWQYPASPFSEIGSRLHFTPLWIPDGDYPVLSQLFYAWSPVGQIFDYQIDSIRIQGDMYDRVTVVRR